MLEYLVRRILIMIPTLLAISLIVFLIIELPPGDYLESYISELQAQGEEVELAFVADGEVDFGAVGVEEGQAVAPVGDAASEECCAGVQLGR